MDELRVCHLCGYQRGFHLSFRFEEEGQKVLLICPGCGQSYDPGWVIQNLNSQPVRGRKIE